jgi:hypothetical protein
MRGIVPVQDAHRGVPRDAEAGSSGDAAAPLVRDERRPGMRGRAPRAHARDLVLT